MSVGELIDLGTEAPEVSGDAMRMRAAESAALYGNVYVDRGTGEVLDARAVLAQVRTRLAPTLRRLIKADRARLRRMHSSYSRRSRRRNRRG